MGRDWIAELCTRSKSQKRFRIPVNVRLNDISLAAETSVTKLGMVMHHYDNMSQIVRKIDLLSSKSKSQLRIV